MCAIFGALIWNATPPKIMTANSVLNKIASCSLERGRDGWGFHVKEYSFKNTGYNFEERSVERSRRWEDAGFFCTDNDIDSAAVIGNFRAEPTTEFVAEKREFDQQPYRCGKWNIVHNGTIANDGELRTGDLPTNIDSAAIVEILAQRDEFNYYTEAAVWFEQCIRQLLGSYAILATHDDLPDSVFVACNYRPIWYANGNRSTYFASSKNYFPETLNPIMVEPYSAWVFKPGYKERLDVPATKERKRALCVCSGGMDSVVAATAMIADGYDVELLHFRYGSRAQDPEGDAIQSIAAYMGVNLHFMTLAIYDPQDSPLLQADSKIAGGEEGAEFAHEWVPARNLVMLSVATACAEAKGFDVLVLGNNLEEAGAYPDNEPEFINRFNDILPFAVGDGKRLRVVMPVGNLMKHEIVELGHRLGAPLHLTWSCYRAGESHCGTCGPCFMRRTAYQINGIKDPIEYLA